MARESESGDHVVIEMAELSPSDKEDEAGSDRKRPDVPWTSSTTVQTRKQRDDEFDQDMLRRAIADTGRWAYGTISVEAWVLSEEMGVLVRPKRAFWFDPVVVSEGAENEALMRLVDEGREDFVAPNPLAPGIGLAGALWSELSGPNSMGMPRQSTMSRRSTMPPRRASFLGGLGNDGMKKYLTGERVAWREVEPISDDPDQPYNLRLQLAVEAGIGLAAGVRFHFRGVQGLVVYMARGKADFAKLTSATNEQYLLGAADVIGSIVALRAPRRECLEERRAERENVRRRVRQKILAVVRFRGSLRRGSGSGGEDDDTPTSPSRKSENVQLLTPSDSSKLQNLGGKIKGRIMLMARKWKGANNEPPPPMITTESIWTFVGCFLTLLMLLSFSDAITARYPEYNLVMGPFGALVTLQYSLTAAPASQPRNVILGQTIALSVAMIMTYTSLEANLRKSLGTALAILLMARLGVTHPPAGAAALIFVGEEYSWGHVGTMLAGNILAILFATLINDMNIKRQYPTFWGFGHWRKMFDPVVTSFSKIARNHDKKEDESPSNGNERFTDN